MVYIILIYIYIYKYVFRYKCTKTLYAALHILVTVEKFLLPSSSLLPTYDKF